MHAYSISNDGLTALLQWTATKATQGEHNAGRDNNLRAYSFEDTKRTVTFISNYAEDHALVLPGRVRSYKRDDIKSMPSSETKIKAYTAYTTAMQDLGR